MSTVSVIIPAHPARMLNGMLQRALSSVWAQTRVPDAVHIVIDTGREGAAATRQRALMAASTDFVAFLDSDDLFLPKHLEWLMTHQEETVDECVEHRLVAFTAATGPDCETEDVIGRQTPARLYGSSDFTVKQRFVLSGEM